MRQSSHLLNAFVMALTFCSLIPPALAQGLATAQSALAFRPVRGTYAEVPGSLIEISNMPRLRSQGSFPICHGFAPATLAQAYICKIKKIADCSNVSSDDEISPLSMAAFGKVNSKDEIPGYTSSHTNINFSGQSGVTALLYSVNNFRFITESCYSFDFLVKKFGNNGEAGAKVLLGRLRDIYNNRYAANSCEECIVKELNAELGLVIDSNGLQSAFKKASYEEFLYAVFFRDCTSVRFTPRPRFDFYPQKESRLDEVDFIGKGKEILENGHPFQLSNICVVRSFDSKCVGTHTLIVSGYKEVCNAQKLCRKLFKVQNSWGAEWQKEYDNGWLDAESLIKNLDEGPTIKSAVISWLR